jgi:phage regulator Rha-like protein
MLDFDLAALYEVPTKRLKEQVRRNIQRFPDDFMFELSEPEWRELVANCDRFPETMKHSSVPPFAFTEHGVTMLASVLRSETAVKISIQVVRAFVAMRQLLMSNTIVTAELAEIRAKLALLEHTDEETLEALNDLSEDLRRDIDNIYTAIAELSIKKPATPRAPIGYKK